ncbi:MAG: pectinesterase family protein [Bacteroidales bacterium]
MKRLLLTSFLLLIGVSFNLFSKPVNVNGQGRNLVKSEVWDFGADQLDQEFYVNHLTVEVINAWYPEGTLPGTAGLVMPSTFSVGDLTWIGGTNDRLRTSNTELTRYDSNGAATTTIGDVSVRGALYVNAGSSKTRYFEINLKEDDQLYLYARSDAGGSVINFVNSQDEAIQNEQYPLEKVSQKIPFVAKAAGKYRIFDSGNKPYYHRLERRAATYTSISGRVEVSQGAFLPEGTTIEFVNEMGKVWSAPIVSGSYTISIPMGYSYELMLNGASDFVITQGATIVTSEEHMSHSITLSSVALNRLSGNIVGLDSEISKLSLKFESDLQSGNVYEPEVSIDRQALTYSVLLEPGVAYSLTAEGVNDYMLLDTDITINSDEVRSINFEAKPCHQVTISAEGLTAEQLASMNYTFTNLKESGYSYTFVAGESIHLRDGVYSVSCSGLNELPLEMGLTSNLYVDGASISKSINFKSVSNWPFNDMLISNSTSCYKGIHFSGNVKNEQSKGHLVAGSGAQVKVPVVVGEKIIVTFYYSAGFSIEGGETIVATTSAGSTSKTEQVEYRYMGEDATFVTIDFKSTSYITNIETVKVSDYRPELRVGVDQEFKTINEALTLVSQMQRDSNERVSILIEPGNYEEMLVIKQPNISLVNTASEPSIALENKGVDIADGAVRITSYYGHGYNYFSMHNQKWSAEHLNVNRENGYISSTNAGSGTTNASYWNATVVILADGFEAENIIFENSFNQYISKKESEDIVEEWISGGKGTRPMEVGSTDVQNRSYVERAAAVAIANNIDKTVFNNCRIVGRQDSFFGGVNSRVAYYKGVVMGAVDYIFGGMVAVFYKTELAMNTSDASSDQAYITAAQQSSGRGYLMYECSITSAKPEIESASSSASKPGYFGRPWQGVTSEVVFFNTTIDSSEFPGYEGKSLIAPLAWTSSLGGESQHCYEYNTKELSGEDNSSYRASWTNLISEPRLKDGTEITPFNFTKGNDGWDPITTLIESDEETSTSDSLDSTIKVFANNGSIVITGVNKSSVVRIYTINGAIILSNEVEYDTQFNLPNGIYLVQVVTKNAALNSKVVIR